MPTSVALELLINIFIPNTLYMMVPGITRENRNCVTSAYLPLTERTGTSRNLGTRHRAAIGLSEVSDA